MSFFLIGGEIDYSWCKHNQVKNIKKWPHWKRWGTDINKDYFYHLAYCTICGQPAMAKYVGV